MDKQWLIKAFWIFIAMTVLDIVFALYVIYTAEKNIFYASLMAAEIQLLNIFVVSSFVKDSRMALPLAVGAFIGTWITLVLF